MRYVGQRDALAKCASLVVESPCEPSSTNAGVVVHLSCDLPYVPTFRDDDFDVNTTALELSRRVEMKQYIESSTKHCTKDKVGGGETCTTTYTYELDYSANFEEFSNSQAPACYENPRVWEYSSRTYKASSLNLGEFLLPGDMVTSLISASPIVANNGLGALAKCPPNLSSYSGCARNGEVIALTGYTKRSKQCYDRTHGNLRVTFSARNSSSASVVAVQAGSSGSTNHSKAVTFAPYSKKGYDCYLIEPGTVSADDMFKHANDANTGLLWTLRIVGFILMWLGLYLVLSPTGLIVDLVPFIGPCISDFVEMGIAVVTFLNALILSLITIAIAWLVARPIIGIPLLIGAVLVAGGVFYWRHTHRKKKAGANGASPYQQPYFQLPPEHPYGVAPPPQNGAPQFPAPFTPYPQQGYAPPAGIQPAAGYPPAIYPPGGYPPATASYPSASAMYPPPEVAPPVAVAYPPGTEYPPPSAPPVPEDKTVAF